MRRTRPDVDVVAALLDQGEWPTVRELVGIAEAPFMRGDGTICQTPGYDVETGRLYIPSIAFPSVRDEPTQRDARANLAELADLFVDFPHAKPAHKMVPIAHLLTLLARPAIARSTPAFCYDASTRGSGKSLQTDVVSMLATGRCMPRMNFTGNEDEQEKILGALALEGASEVSFDNVSASRPFGGAPIERALTVTGKIKFRILGVSDVPALLWLAVISATGNNMSFTPDAVRRVLVSRLTPKEARPEDRTGFKHPRLIEHVHKHRARLVAAALTVLRASASASG